MVGRTGYIVDPQGIAQLLRSIDGYQGQPVTAAALKLAPLLFVRPGELRAAEWKEFDLDRAEWRIAAERIKRWVLSAGTV
jgi:integrase